MGMFSGIATSAAGTNQSALGLYQLWRARKVKPDNYVPPSLQKSLNEAEAVKGRTKYINQDYDEAQVRRASANAVSRAKESTTSAANLLNATSAVQSNENDALNQIGNKARQFQEVNRMNAQNLRNQRAGYEMDSMKRYWAAKAGLKGAGMQNLMQGQASIHQGAGSFLDSMFSMGGMGGGMGGGGGNLAGSMGGAMQNNPMSMMPAGYSTGNTQNPLYNNNIMTS